MRDEWYQRGFGVSPKGAQYLVSVLRFATANGRYPTLRDLSSLLRMRAPSLSRLERTLRRLGLLLGARKQAGLKVASHVLLSAASARLLVQLKRCTEAGLIPAEFELEHAEAVWTQQPAPASSSTTQDPVRSFVKEAVANGYIVAAGKRLAISEARWAREALLIEALTDEEINTSAVPRAVLFDDGPVREMLFSHAIGSGMQRRKLVHAGEGEEEREVLLQVSTRAELESRGPGRWAVRVSVDWPDGPDDYGIRLVTPLGEVLEGKPDHRGVIWFENIDDAMARSLRNGARFETVTA